MKKLIALTVCFMFLGVTICFAEPLQESKPLRESGAEMGFELSHITYEEPGVMEEKGIMYGVGGSYIVHQGNKFMFGLEGKFSLGQVDYDGKLSDGTPYTIDDITDYILEGRLLAGYDCPASKTTVITPYIGIGYRYLNDAMGEDARGYERESNYFYSPIGIDIIANLENGWSIGVIAEYDIFWYGLQRSHLGDVYTGVDVVENDQKKGYGARGSIKIQKKGKKIDFIIEPFIKYWDIKQSDTSAITLAGTHIVGYGWEPENNSTEYGIKLAVKF